MAYIGNQPASAFASTEKQTITGNGTTGPYALTHEVAAATDIACFVNNVRQEPGVAYTVSGNQMTMTGNVASTDDFYVVYLGRVVGTAAHPANSGLAATSGTFSGDITAQNADLTGSLGLGTSTPAKKLTVDGDADFNVALRSSSTRTGIGFYAPGTGSLGNPAGSMLLLSDNTFRMGTASVYGLIMNQSGHVTMPYQPGFLTYAIGAISSPATIVGGTVRHNIGNHYNSSTGAFTAPIQGRYHFTAGLLTSAANARLEMFLRVNGGNIIAGNESVGPNAHGSAVIAVTLNLSANDVVTLFLVSGTMHSGHSNNYFGCHLVG